MGRARRAARHAWQMAANAGRRSAGADFFALVLTMVTLATGTVILFATRAGLLANQEILDVLHQIGAHDSYISRRFEGHFVRLTAGRFIRHFGGLPVFYLFAQFCPMRAIAIYIFGCCPCHSARFF